MKKTASVLRDHVTEIMERWQTEVTSQVQAAKETNLIALYDHLPNIIHDIADIMERYSDLEDIREHTKYKEILENSKEHGRHRATTSNYTVEQVIHEYIIFHRTISNLLKSHNGYNEEVSDLLKYVIETSILKSVGSFSSSIQEMQEKLIGTLAHDIRNPLSVTQLALEMLKEDEDKDSADKMINAAQRSLGKAINLIEGLMNGITIKAGEGMMFDFEERNILADIEWVYEEAKEIYVNEIIFNCDESSITGIFDSTAIRRLLENLIGNAVKYGFPKKPITVSVSEKNNSVEIVVHNHGNPISEEKQKHIFDFLAREKKGKNSAKNSWGMGLTLAQIVTKAHGGTIDLISTENKGTSFIITLLKNYNKIGKRRTKLTYVEEYN